MARLLRRVHFPRFSRRVSFLAYYTQILHAVWGFLCFPHHSYLNQMRKRTKKWRCQRWELRDRAWTGLGGFECSHLGPPTTCLCKRPQGEHGLPGLPPRAAVNQGHIGRCRCPLQKGQPCVLALGICCPHRDVPPPGRDRLL